jgi:hypothetical protein
MTLLMLLMFKLVQTIPRQGDIIATRNNGGEYPISWCYF